MSSMFEHVDVLSALIGALFLIISFFLVRTIQSIDANQKELFNRMHQLEMDFYTLQGEHKTRHKISEG